MTEEESTSQPIVEGTEEETANATKADIISPDNANENDVGVDNSASPDSQDKEQQDSTLENSDESNNNNQSTEESAENSKVENENTNEGLQQESEAVVGNDSGDTAAGLVSDENGELAGAENTDTVDPDLITNREDSQDSPGEEENNNTGEEGTTKPPAQPTNNDNNNKNNSANEEDEIDVHELAYQQQREKRQATIHAQLTDQEKAPKQYYTNTKKENQVLDYVENFNRQYGLLYPGRKDLILSPPNEFEINKFICTSIRPTQLPYKELYDYQGCAKFVADYMEYIPLEPPHELPQVVPSPSYTIKMQSGNSFDLSILLVSLLRGVGYDAYVVSGYATQEITLMDESRTDMQSMELIAKALGFSLPLQNNSINGGGAATTDSSGNNNNHSNNSGNGNSSEFWMTGEESKETIDESGKVVNNKFKIRPPKMLVSQYMLKQESRKKEKEVKAAEVKKREAEAAMNEEEEEDDLKGLRVHAWVLVLPGKREIAEPFYIESSTGKVYPTDCKHLLGIESVFNSSNYWVNMQVCYDGVKGISLDVGDNSKWEFVFLDNTQPGLQLGKEQDDDEDDDDKAEILDLPTSWVQRLTLNKEDFQTRCPSGTKTILYKNARLELFAEYIRDDGMVARISLFADEVKNFNGEIKEIFKNRKDKLWQRIKNPDIDKVHEFFEPGRPHSLKSHVIVAGQTKEMHFYSSARSDGLVLRVDDVIKVTEYFTDREDRLVYRSVAYEVPNNKDIEKRTPYKLTEKYNRNPEIPACEDQAKKTNFLNQDKIRVVYHVEDGYIIPSYIEFKKPTPEQKGNFSDLTTGYFDVDALRPKPKKQHLMALLHQLIRSEQACLHAIKMADREIKEILSSRVSEEKDISLLISVYDTIRNNSKYEDEEIKEIKGEAEDEQAADVDYLSPFLINRSSSDKLTKEEAISVRDACLKSMKERIVEKTSIIQSRLDEVSSEYSRRQLAYSKNADSMTVEETEEYVKFCNNALFKIHILEKRLAKHKESVPEKYAELGQKLDGDKRLALY